MCIVRLRVELERLNPALLSGTYHRAVYALKCDRLTRSPDMTNREVYSTFKPKHDHKSKSRLIKFFQLRRLKAVAAFALVLMLFSEPFFSQTHHAV